MDKPLHRHIGALIFKTSSESDSYAKGTGILISPDLVLTVAHNLCSMKSGENYTDFKFYPGHHGKMHEYYTVSSYYIPQRYFLN